MAKIADKLIFDFVKQQYCPYDTHEAFVRGFAAYQAGDFNNPHAADSIAAQAWDFGAEAAMKCARATA